ncbi:hypothetical protein [Pseudomonas helleri]|uniref:hypothetical protein n=1 Tax=Pseudomonas helleri TaxID=1608996 RepID=UPI00242BF7C8|nr:hypothetical protein [Pseudomonas helleri]
MITLATVVVLYLVSVAIAIALFCHLTWKWSKEQGDYKICVGLGFIWIFVAVVALWMGIEYCWDRFFGWIDELLVKFQDKVIEFYKKGD